MTDPRYPLAGIRVVALEQAVAAPLASRHLADLGADVIKIERPEGDFARRYDSVVKGESTYFAWLNRGKRSLVLDLRLDEDRTVLEGLLAESDVFLHNLGPGAVDRLGYGWDTLHERWPRLISCAVSGYGADGPYKNRKAFDLLLQGESGLISVTGSPNEMAKVGVSIGDISSGVYSLSAILAALFLRERTGEGQQIDIAMLAPAYHQLYGPAVPPRAGLRHNAIVPYGPYATGSGLVNLAVQNEGQWERFCSVVLQDPGIATHEHYRSNELRVRNRAELERMIEERFGSLSRAEVEARLEQADVPYGSLNQVSDLVAHPQLEARGRWHEVASAGGEIRALAHPMNIGDMPQRMDPVPAIGEHSSEIREQMATRAR
jgi:crotonobetainyl-CoA:carnitine CoA-transferase CaiB-like acyl-CoA transferase